MGHWLAHFFGFANGDGNDAHYLFWSGPGSDITELAILGGLISVARRHNCHVKRCWRVGRQQVEGTTFVVCRKHHPEGKPTAEHIEKTWRERSHLYVGSKPGRG